MQPKVRTFDTSLSSIRDRNFSSIRARPIEVDGVDPTVGRQGNCVPCSRREPSAGSPVADSAPQSTPNSSAKGRWRFTRQKGTSV
jgi:hypothetical protein